MGKSLEGSITWKEKRKRWEARISPVNPETGKQQSIRRYCLTKAEAQKKLRDLLTEYEAKPQAIHASAMTFRQLAAAFRKAELIDAQYLNDRKVAGHRNNGPLLTYLKRAIEFFGDKKIREIRLADVRAYRLQLIETPTKNKKARSISDLNKTLGLLRRVLNFAVENEWLMRSPFAAKTGQKLIDIQQEHERNRFPTFGEEIELLRLCTGRAKRMRAVLIVAADTGLRRNEMLTLTPDRFDFERKVIELSARNTKGNRSREIPMTPRVERELRALVDDWSGRNLFGAPTIRRAFNSLCKRAQIDDLHFHDFRHAFVTRSILAGIPAPVVLKASGHIGDKEWKRYANFDPRSLSDLLKTHGKQSADEVRYFAVDVMRGLRDALGFTELERLFEWGR